MSAGQGRIVAGAGASRTATAQQRCRALGKGAGARCELADTQRTGAKNKGHVHVNQPNRQETGRELFDYVYDRVAGHFKLPSLADLIAQKAQALTA